MFFACTYCLYTSPVECILSLIYQYLLPLTMAVFSNIWLNIWYPEFFCFYRRFDFSLMFQCCFYFFQKSLTLFCTLSPFCYVSIMTVIGTHSLAMFIVLHCSISLRYFICIKDAYKEHIILGLWRRNIFRNMEHKKLFFFQCTCN